ncbi:MULTISPECIES: DUF2683 family protein [Cysteiniphilum]|uniref:DUF2683 family protein n=2 Tax=Fastidiosibacteraceae TaxID=2056687 RepID=UPI001780C46F|nr:MULTISPECIES: DUF2683 family protein [Cysteiniphilum]
MDNRKKTYIKSQKKRSDNMKEFGYTQISDWIKNETKIALEEIKTKHNLRRKGEAIDLLVESYLKE